MKVWGKDVKSCSKCSMYYTSEYTTKCLYTDEYLREYFNDSINENCPFSKPITKEVIESYGFFLIEKYPDELVFEKKDGDYCLYELSLQLEENEFYITQWAQGSLVAKVLPKEKWNTFNLFCGILNNPVELEFILKSIEVI